MSDPEALRDQKKIERETKEDARRRDQEAKKFLGKLEADRKRADAAVEHFEKEVRPKELEKARAIRDYETFLAENGLAHNRQPNEGAENYTELPKSVHVETPETDDVTPAPDTQVTTSITYDVVLPPPGPFQEMARTPENPS
jgi:chromosome segregation ATPase